MARRLRKWSPAPLTVGLVAVFLLATPAVAANRGGVIRVIVNFRSPQGAQPTATSAKRTIEAANGKVQHRFRLIDSAAATIPASELAALRGQPNVASVEIDHRLTAFSDPELDDLFEKAREQVYREQQAAPH